MLTGVSDSLAGIASTAADHDLSLGARVCDLTAAFCLMINERKREFAVLRVAGASRRMLSRMIVSEAAYLSLAAARSAFYWARGGIPFAGLIESRLGLPFLTPPLWLALLQAAATLLVTVVAGRRHPATRPSA